MTIENRIAQFQKDLKSISTSLIVQKHITYGDCYALDQTLYFDLKTRIAKNFNLHPSEVLMVGSGKLGFSLVSSQRYRPFHDESDIDIALVSPVLFDKIWMEVFEYKASGSYWPDFDQFTKYLFKGWIRPDKLPPSKEFEVSQNWWDFFREITSSHHFGPYQIRAGVYKSWQFLESYQSKCVSECLDAIGDSK